MGWSRRRGSRDGTVRFTAYYRDLRGRTCCAGTFPTKRRADQAWQRQEARIAAGRVFDPRRGRQTFRRYVEDEWLPHIVVEASTREAYYYQLHRHIMPWFGPMRMIEILPTHVREWITHLVGEGVTPATIRNLKAILSAIFTTAMKDQVTFLHPCKGVRAPTVPTKPKTIITPEQFDAIYACLPTADAQLLVETKLETGLRWGELTELRVRDINRTTGILTVSRAVVQVDPKFHPEGGRFLVKEYPKDKEYRLIALSTQITRKLLVHAKTMSLKPDDLLFSTHTAAAADRPPDPAPDPQRLGWITVTGTDPRYRHGTLSGYSAGKCRCQHCRAAYAVYRATRRAQHKDSPRQRRTVATDGHIPRDWFRVQIWRPALMAAALDGLHVRIHDLRHAHASWLLAGGADLQVVKERLGHASITTTEKYLHTLSDADKTALGAFAKIRNRSRASA